MGVTYPYRIAISLSPSKEVHTAMGVDQRGIIKYKKAAVPGSGRPEPTGVTREAGKHWRKIVEAMPDGWFGPEVIPVLRCLCSAIATWEKVEAEIPEVTAQQDWAALDTLTRLQERQTKVIGDMSTRLRLTPKSKWGQEKASTKQALGASKRPWTNVA